ncbi:MAG: IPT/TIG domain-containing protein [Bacteroidetes bacterium]|nr:IPT/TIG domain-containing protein [Bacteroidota bacterium]
MKSINSVFIKLLAILMCCSIILLIITSCEKEKKDPVLETTSIQPLSPSHYFVSAKLTERGDYTITDYGIAYYVGSSTSPPSYYNFQKVSIGTTPTADTFSLNINIGQIGSYYSNYRCYVKAYVTNERGTLYGSLVSTDIAVLSLQNLVPGKGRSGDTITIHGNYFASDPFQNQVYFDNVLANIISGDKQTLRVIVPDNITSYYTNTVSVLVKSDGFQAELSNAFTLLVSPTGFTPKNGTWEDYVHINGAGLYNTALYFDDEYILTNTDYTTSIGFYIPNEFLKKKFKLYLEQDGVKTEVPGGYFEMADLHVTSPGNTEYNWGSTLCLSGTGFNPNESITKLLLGNYVLHPYSSSGSYAYFDIPYSIPVGPYYASLTNGIDTVMLGSQITITGK